MVGGDKQLVAQELAGLHDLEARPAAERVEQEAVRLRAGREQVDGAGGLLRGEYVEAEHVEDAAGRDAPHRLVLREAALASGPPRGARRRLPPRDRAGRRSDRSPRSARAPRTGRRSGRPDRAPAPARTARPPSSALLLEVGAAEPGAQAGAARVERDGGLHLEPALGELALPDRGEPEAEPRQRRLAVDRDRSFEGGLGGGEPVGGERREALDRPPERRLGDRQRPGHRRLGRAPIADRQLELRQARPRIGVVWRRLDRGLGGGEGRVELALRLQRIAPRDMRGPEAGSSATASSASASARGRSLSDTAATARSARAAAFGPPLEPRRRQRPLGPRRVAAAEQRRGLAHRRIGDAGAEQDRRIVDGPVGRALRPQQEVAELRRDVLGRGDGQLLRPRREGRRPIAGRPGFEQQPVAGIAAVDDADLARPNEDERVARRPVHGDDRLRPLDAGVDERRADTMPAPDRADQREDAVEQGHAIRIRRGNHRHRVVGRAGRRVLARKAELDPRAAAGRDLVERAEGRAHRNVERASRPGFVP